jgi:2'-5' RNA ligase
MPFALYLDLDAAGTRDFDRLAGLIERVDAAISTPGRLGHTHHITLGVYDELDIAGIEHVLSEIASVALEITFPAICIFPGERSVLFAAPKVTNDLLDFHERYHQLAEPYGNCDNHYKPGAWFPHMTLGVNLARCDRSAALNAVSDEWTPVTCRLDTIRLIHFSPVKTLSLWPLG